MKTVYSAPRLHANLTRHHMNNLVKWELWQLVMGNGPMGICYSSYTDILMYYLCIAFPGSTYNVQGKDNFLMAWSMDIITPILAFLVSLHFNSGMVHSLIAFPGQFSVSNFNLLLSMRNIGTWLQIDTSWDVKVKLRQGIPLYNWH